MVNRINMSIDFQFIIIGKSLIISQILYSFTSDQAKKYRNISLGSIKFLLKSQASSQSGDVPTARTQLAP